MSKSKKMKTSRSKPKPPGYDVPMIRDFLEHLMWEVRARHHEHAYPSSKNNDELCDQLAKYMQRRNTIGLMAATLMASDTLNEPGFAAASADYRAVCVRRDEKLIAALELLGPLFSEALECATRPEHLCTRTLTMQKMREAIDSHGKTEEP